MGMYKFKAIDLEGNIVKGKRSVVKKEELISDISEEGLFLLDYKGVRNFNSKTLLKKVTTKDIGLICKQIGELLTAGINIKDTLEVLSNQNTNCLITDSLNCIKEDIEEGKTLFQSMKCYPKIYPEFMIQMISIGEKSGNLDNIFIKLSNYYMEKYKIQKKIKEGLRYPLAVLMMTVILTILIIFKIIPEFIDDFKNLNVSIPIGLQRIIKLNKILISYKFYLTLLTVCLIIYTLNKKGCLSEYLEKIKFKTFLGSIYNQIYEINILKSLSILLQCGIPIINSLYIIENDINNKFLKRKLLGVINTIQEGSNFTEALKREQMVSEFFICMISLGEETGKIEELIESAVDIKQDDIKRVIEKIVASIEPITIIILGIIVMIVMMSIISPMIDAMDSII